MNSTEASIPTEKKLLFYIPVAYSIPCYIFYVFTIHVLSLRRFQNYFGSTFFKLFKVQGVLDLIVHLINWPTLRIPFSGLFNDFFRDPTIETGCFPTILIFINYWHVHVYDMNATETSPSTSKYILFYTSLGYSIPCYALYMFTVYILSSKRYNKNFKTSFFTLFKLQALLDLGNELFNWLCWRIPFSGLFNSVMEIPVIKTGPLPTALYFLCYYLPYSQLICFVLISLNRLVVIALPPKFQELWQRSLWPCMVFVLVFPILLTWHILIGGAFFSKMGDVYNANYNKFGGIRNSLYMLVMTVSASGLSFICNICVIVYIVTHKTTKKSWTEIKLFFMTLALFVIHLTQALLQLVAYVNVSCNAACLSLILTMNPYLTDLACLSSPVFLLLSSSPFRTAVKAFFTNARIISPQNSIMKTQNIVVRSKVSNMSSINT
ncbi:hypothetical protein QR680_014106 [Steinernema hermaphroditum]|uniref:Serpentine receptor class gamma n=1 Tax=Steinernema hermaphroditum TaxID=289476 RepID=A0AA39I7R3_9BILA|nr:hypothetical protein QR680_014106 [Steinernema hermaphroditum]